MVHIVKETVHQNSKRIWGYFKLSDNSRTRFEKTATTGWIQWGNTTDKLGITLDRVKQLTADWDDRRD